jgi:hypothetical protein
MATSGGTTGWFLAVVAPAAILILSPGSIIIVSERIKRVQRRLE